MNIYNLSHSFNSLIGYIVSFCFNDFLLPASASDEPAEKRFKDTTLPVIKQI